MLFILYATYPLCYLTYKKSFRELIIYFHKLRRYVFTYRIVTIGKNYIQLADYSWPSCPNSQQNFPVIVTVLCGTGGTKLRFSCGQEPSNPISCSIGNHVEPELYLFSRVTYISYQSKETTDRYFDDM